MGFRPDLDLSGILSQYQVFGGTPRSGRESDHLSVLAETTIPPDPPDEPIRCGYGAEWCSSETALALSPEICWDANGYYRELGVHWRASRRELREAYRERNGDQSIRLTYVFCQLLDPQIRAAYDRTPLGEVFMDDWVQEDLKRRARAEAYRRSMCGVESHRDDVLQEWGYASVPEDTENDGEPVDSDDELMQDEPRYQESWGYAFYLLRTIFGDEDLLREWQELLLRELSVRGCTVRFSVGMVGKEHAPALFWVNGQDFIFFLNEEHRPTPELATQVVERAITHSITPDLSPSLHSPN